MTSTTADNHVTMSRNPSDLQRLLVFAVIAAAGYVMAVAATRTTSGAESDLRGLLAQLPGPALALLVFAVQVLHLLLFLGIPLVLLLMRRWRQWAIYTGGYLAAFIVSDLAARATRPSQPGALPEVSFFEIVTVEGGSWPPSSSVATGTAALIMLSPLLNRQWRRFGWIFVGLLALVRIITASEVVFDLLFSFGIGGVVGSLILLVFGRPVPVPSLAGIADALARLGMPDARVMALDHESRGSLPYLAELPDGRRVHCKVVTEQQYQADSLWRAYRRVRVRELGEDVAYSTVRRAAAVESLLALSAGAAGANTPAMYGVAAVDDVEMLIAFQDVPGQTLDRVPAEAITDDVLHQAWTSIAALRRAQIAHRDLQLSSWLLGEDGQLRMIDFSFGEPAATPGAMRADLAEFLAATYPLVGAQRAVQAALAVLGPQALGSGISHLVPAALTKATRSAVKATPGGLDPLVEQVATACAVEKPQFAPIERVKPRTLVMAGLLAVAVYVLLPQLTDLPRMIDAIREADPLFIAAAAAGSLATYVGVAMALVGSISAPIRFGYGFLAAWASSFVGAVAPPGVAHVGLNVRLAQRQGLEPPAAVSAAAAKEVAVGAVHVVLLLLAAILAGSSDALSKELDRLPSPTTIGIAAAVLLVLIGIAVAMPRTRRFVRGTVVPAVLHSVDTLRQLASDPTRMLTLFGGALVLQTGYIAALYCSVRALGGDVPLVTIALIYLTVGSAAAVAPTPGGVGAVEAVLLAALTGVGMAAAPALAAVFLYRLVTFWVPIPIGALALRFLTAREVL